MATPTTAAGVLADAGTLTGGPRTRQSLPPRLLQDRAIRLVWLAGTTAILIVGVEVGQYFLQPELAAVFEDPLNRLVSLATVLMALGLVALHRYRVVTASTIFAFGAAFQVLVAICISMIETSKPFPPDEPVLGISALGPWIFVAGAFIPNKPLVTLSIALVEAAMWPAAYFFNVQRFGYEPMAWNHFAVWPGINFLLALLAFHVGRRMYGTAIAAQRAVELGSYRLVAPIGEGGMGEVWQATHQMLARKAAIKLVRPEGLTSRQSEIASKRFKREANLIAGLQSPNTIYLYDFGEAQDGRFYYVMELLDGISLQTLVTKFGPQPASRVGQILRQVCESLEEAHRYSMVHRDLKPSNIMICKVALAHDVVKVLDFGLAKCVACTDDAVTQLTQEGVASGTPGYIAPEIALGETAIDHRADIYALGCVAYFLLTGTLVFNDPNPVSMALKHVQTPPDPPSLRTELPIPAALEAIVLKCLAKKAADRPENAREIAQLLNDANLEPWTRDDADAWWERHLPRTSSLRSNAIFPDRTPHVVEKV